MNRLRSQRRPLCRAITDGAIVLALAASTTFSFVRQTEADERPQLPYLVPQHGYESACPQAAPHLPESRGRILHVAVAATGDGTSPDRATTLDHAVSMAMPGDTILLAPGYYDEFAWPAELGGVSDNPITLRAEHPAVHLSGEAPNLAAMFTAPELVSELSLQLHHASHVRVDGIYGRIEVHKSSHIELLNNHHRGHDGQNIQLTRSNDISVHHNLIENFELRSGYAGESWFTDYGAANYFQERLAYHHNYFNGGFNHAISLKTSNNDVTISCNRFNNCGRRCLELGQQTDGRLPAGAPTDRTSQRVLVKRNLFEMTDRTYVNADFAIMIMNVDDVILEENRFTGIFTHSILLSNYWAPTYCASTGETMSQVGILPNATRIANNHFDGETNIRITGRGVIGDRLEIGGVSGGPVSCEVMDLAPITCEDACCLWDPSPDSEKAPEISLLDESIICG